MKLKTFKKKNQGHEKSIQEIIREHKKKKLIKGRKSAVLHRKNRVRHYLNLAGIGLGSHKISKIIFHICIFLNLALSAYLIYRFSTDWRYGVFYVSLAMLFVWIFVFLGLLLTLWLIFYIVIDLRIFKRRVGIEEVLADFLQLTSANVRAGMSIDKALWYAVRPQFGVLGKEIEIVAKETMSGKDLESALRGFSDKYDSPVLKRSINLLIEGIEAGGEIGDLLNKIAVDIQESTILKKELAANVTTYVIFITFASILAAPLMFALSGQMLGVIDSLMVDIDVPAGAAQGINISLSESSISARDFRIFAVLCLFMTSYFSAIIVATIKKGDVKAGFKYIPTFIAVSILLFFIFSFVLGGFFGGIM